ncbi:hypothetical protein WN48_06958 [Eufriesea mexicana]|uniref:Uncharacterized protein n=2 Tax=Eufriesea mexicana TaxID=516756 RepID=A0A310SSJ8_9HYME|nr:hypothetical protein WN48_06958 [Eufriesea mexicana]
MSINEKTQTEYTSFKELDESGLTPAVFDPLINATFLIDDPSFLSLKKKVIPISEIGDCMLYLKRYRNVTCFSSSEIANIAINQEARRGLVTMKICKNLCYAKPPVANFMSKHTPYRDRIVEIIMRLHIAGIKRKWHYDYIGKFINKHPRVMRFSSLSKSSYTRNLVYILSGGYFLSFFVFFGEILIHGMGKNCKQAGRF